ncbi:hypothetical protein KORDIASMS9_03017 [Kordia sp. SMS9]|uniref:hypothetical protein n=1 Tax=Kordia sp. SMS9 TaxID=2282170 RepID=UPI000E0D0AE5|nr:hypothetical protein [Kordia sp. SMS9]AXG70771.1 hypothetical protein KORDIASMS9_03017 [Kordia sp. SMS9]
MIKIVLYIIGIIVAFIVVALLLIFMNYFLFIKPKDTKRGWRIRSLGRDAISYQEKIGNEWKGIKIDGEMLIGKIRKVLFFKTEEKWTEYPEWAQHREKIIDRIKLDFPPKTTEYKNDE